MGRHVHLDENCKSQDAHSLDQVPALSSMPPHLELKAVAAHGLETPPLVKPERRLHVVSAVVVVPQQFVIGTRAKEALAVIIR